jgi:hypothetical protein
LRASSTTKQSWRIVGPTETRIKHFVGFVKEQRLCLEWTAIARTPAFN